MSTDPPVPDAPCCCARPHLLLAEDDPDLRGWMATAFRLDGFHVLEACDGHECLLRFAECAVHSTSARPLDLVVTDVRMPGYSGLEVVSQLRRSDRDTPVILVTAFADLSVRAEAAQLGVSVVLEKPVELAVLRAAASDAVALRDALRP